MSHGFKVLFSAAAQYCSTCERFQTHTTHGRCLVCSKRDVRERYTE